jgi:hypothetical protein
MSNRQARRHGYRLTRGATARVAGDQLRIMQDRDPATINPTHEHLWVMTGLRRVDPLVALSGEQHLDLENLITVDGPGCYKCEQIYSATVAAQPCEPVP